MDELLALAAAACVFVCERSECATHARTIMQVTSEHSRSFKTPRSLVSTDVASFVCAARDDGKPAGTLLFFAKHVATMLSQRSLAPHAGRFCGQHRRTSLPANPSRRSERAAPPHRARTPPAAVPEQLQVCGMLFCFACCCYRRQKETNLPNKQSQTNKHQQQGAARRRIGAAPGPRRRRGRQHGRLCRRPRLRGAARA